MRHTSAGLGETYDDVRGASLKRPDGRVVAWTWTGPSGGVPILRTPGTPGPRWLVRRLPNATMRELGTADHFLPYQRETDALDEPLGRSTTAAGA